MAYIDQTPTSNMMKDSRETIWKIVEELFPKYRAPVSYTHLTLPTKRIV